MGSPLSLPQHRRPHLPVPYLLAPAGLGCCDCAGGGQPLARGGPQERFAGPARALTPCPRARSAPQLCAAAPAPPLSPLRPVLCPSSPGAAWWARPRSPKVTRAVVVHPLRFRHHVQAEPLPWKVHARTTSPARVTPPLSRPVGGTFPGVTFVDDV